MELHFASPQPCDPSQPDPHPFLSPLRFRIRRHWPPGVAYYKPSEMRGHPIFSGHFEKYGEPVFIDSETNCVWRGSLRDLIDVDWATDPSVIDDEDIPGFQQHIKTMALAKKYGTVLWMAQNETYIFKDDDGGERRLELPPNAHVTMFSWKSEEIPMPSEDRIIRMRWEYVGTETAS
ncbi:hypothetical protein TruAng_008413 [Truncatella angustata]|nr:hypothetical protein TruAng_008413 [Truncatella angustata]